jgi:3-oxoacyl-[acyl-carrier-protein] synthase-3
LFVEEIVMGVGIIGTGYYVPTRILTNKELESMVETTDDWIFSKVGVRERRIAEPNEATSDLAIKAAHEALRNAGVAPEEIDLIILATSSPDMIQPATAAIVQGKLGALNSAAFDVSAVCAGFVYALTVAQAMMKANPGYSKALVIGAETYSRILDWTDRTTCVYFGDGAGAVVLGHQGAAYGIRTTYLKNDGRGAGAIRYQGGGSRHPATQATLDQKLHRFEMNGRAVWDFATKACPESIRKVVGDAGLEVSELDWVITHQANINIIKSSLLELGIPFSKTYTTIEQYANTAGASIPITLAEAHKKGLFKKGDKIVLVGFGGGLSLGAVYLEWGLEHPGAQRLLKRQTVRLGSHQRN